MSTFNKYRLKGAYHYDWYETEDWYKYLVDRCVEFCSRERGDVLDVGCGDGLLLQKLKDKGISSFGIDPDPNAIKLCTEKDIEAYQDILDSDYVKGSKDRDYLTCLNVVEHMDNPDSLRQIIRKKITKGAIITTIDYQGGTLGEDHRFEWTYDEMMEFFKEFNPKGFRYKDTEWIGVEITK